MTSITTPGIMAKLISYGRKYINIGETVTVSVTVKETLERSYRRPFHKGEKLLFNITKYSGVIYKMTTYPYLQNPVLVVKTNEEWICVPYVRSICTIENVMQEKTRDNFTIREEKVI